MSVIGQAITLGGGSGSPELVVIGRTTRPAKPSENMVWIATEREVTSYVFSATEPDNPVEGMVKIGIADGSDIKVTAPLNGDYIKMRMNHAKQYVNGTWQTVRVWMYKDGEWEKMIEAVYGKITVTYPSGSTCTCTDGNTVLVADDDSGETTFLVPNAGTWTVTSTNGEETIVEVVEITTEGQSESIELSYIYYIVKDGKLVVDVMANGKRTETDNYLEFAGTGSGWFQMFHKVDLTKYDRVEIKGEFNTTSSKCLLCVWNENVQPQSASALASISSVQLGNDKPLIVNALTGVHCVGVQTEFTRVQKIKDLYLVPIGG